MRTKKTWLSAPDASAKVSRISGPDLLDVESFAHLIAADEALGRTELLEEAENFAVLEHMGVDGNSGRRDQLDGLGVNYAITVESFSRAAVEQSENSPARMNQIREAVYERLPSEYSSAVSRNFSARADGDSLSPPSPTAAVRKCSSSVVRKPFQDLRMSSEETR
jgi:hypothetical protein